MGAKAGYVMDNYPGSLDNTSTLPVVNSNTLTNSVSHSGLHNTLGAAVIALETKLGTAVSTPGTSGQVLTDMGSGNTAWQPLPQTNLTSGVTGVLPVANGGTNANTAAGARASLSAAASGNNSDITQLSGLTTALSVGQGGTGVTSATALAQLVGGLLMPVGFIYTSTSSTNPGTALGFGTWAAFGGGRVLVGVGTSDQTFTAAATGGESNHTLTTNEMPSHTHNHAFDNSGSGWAANNPISGTNGMTGHVAGSWSDRAGTSISGLVQANGGGASHNNLQPYIVVYMWQRTA